ncbi:HNH endonuclease [Bradyrhizobium sp. USDA 3650]
MRCLFCKRDSSASRSVEHIIPESLGNFTHVLSRGVVCDACNNYFAREVEKPFLDVSGIEILRFHQGLASKKGRVPLISGAVFPNIPVQVTRIFDPNSMVINVPTEAVSRFAAVQSGTLILPLTGPLPVGRLVSRFLAKVACTNWSRARSIC